MLGPAADLTISDYLLRRIELRLAGANWQRGGGKGRRPEPVPLPGEKPREQARPQTVDGDDVARRLRNLGLIPAAAGQTPSSIPDEAPPEPTAAEFGQQVDQAFLDREMRRATEP